MKSKEIIPFPPKKKQTQNKKTHLTLKLAVTQRLGRCLFCMHLDNKVKARNDDVINADECFLKSI